MSPTALSKEQQQTSGAALAALQTSSPSRLAAEGQTGAAGLLLEQQASAASPVTMQASEAGRLPARGQMSPSARLTRQHAMGVAPAASQAGPPCGQPVEGQTGPMPLPLWQSSLGATAVGWQTCDPGTALAEGELQALRRSLEEVQAQVRSLAGKVALAEGLAAESSAPQEPAGEGQPGLRKMFGDLQMQIAELHDLRLDDKREAETTLGGVEAKLLRQVGMEVSAAISGEREQLATTLGAQLEELKSKVVKVCDARPPEPQAATSGANLEEFHSEVVELCRVQQEEMQAELEKIRHLVDCVKVEAGELRQQTARLGDLQQAQASMLEDLQGAATKAETASLIAQRAQAGNDEVFGAGGLADCVQQLQEQHEELAATLQVHQDMFLKERSLASVQASMSRRTRSDRSSSSSPPSLPQGALRHEEGHAGPSFQFPPDRQSQKPLPTVVTKIGNGSQVRDEESSPAGGGVGGGLSPHTPVQETPRGWGAPSSV